MKWTGNKVGFGQKLVGKANASISGPGFPSHDPIEDSAGISSSENLLTRECSFSAAFWTFAAQEQSDATTAYFIYISQSIVFHPIFILT